MIYLKAKIVLFLLVMFQFYYLHRFDHSLLPVAARKQQSACGCKKTTMLEMQTRMELHSDSLQVLSGLNLLSLELLVIGLI